MFVRADGNMTKPLEYQKMASNLAHRGKMYPKISLVRSAVWVKMRFRENRGYTHWNGGCVRLCTLVICTVLESGEQNESRDG